MSIIATRHGPLHYLTVGNGPPFILLHGNTYSAATQVRLAQRFANQFTVYSFDLLGHGSSARPPDLFTVRYFQIQGEAIADALTGLFHQPVPVFGMSAGGISALNAICICPELIAALILDGVFARVTAATYQAHRQATASMSPSWHRYMATQHGADWWPILNAGVEAVIEQLAAQEALVTPCLEQIRVPTIIFHGGKDPFVPDEQVRAIATAIRGARIVYEPEAGHLIAWRNPDAFRTRVGRFLAEHGLLGDSR
ncbi:MAG: alpha/beta hydrolase [Chloroflexus sp.]